MGKYILLSLGVLAILARPVLAGPGMPGHDHGNDHGSGHGHAQFAAGEPGDPKKPARAVVITMRDDDGKMIFNHDHVEVRRGEQIRFVLKNLGELDHEFVLATVAENDRHAAAMRKNPEMEHDDPNAKRLAPKETAEFVWRFTRKGEFQFACLIPGHREAGMVGKVIVK
jgi:uncharacterized cupredoxin-like copper-binding protein